MRRRRDNLDQQKLGLAPETLRPAPVDDLDADYETRRRVWAEWMTERDEWISRRQAYADRHGWPGGELARLHEEAEHHPVPDEPFNPDAEIAAGRL